MKIQMNQQIVSQDFEYSLKKFAEVVNLFCGKLVKALKPLLRAVNKLCELVWDGSWQAYRDAGMPYGESDNGLLKWWRENCESCRVKSAIERERAWKEALERLRFRANKCISV
jgi:hypothetical protein